MSEVTLPRNSIGCPVCDARAQADVERLNAAHKPFAGALGTSELPEDVVAQEVVGMVWMTTDEGDPRHGVMAYAVNLGTRENPKLTWDEAVYVASVYEMAAKAIREAAHG